jgi:hypothetical protein
VSGDEIRRIGGIDMNATWARVCILLALITGAVVSSGAHAQEFLNKEWLLNPALSNVYMQSVKKNAIFETHQFESVEGNVSKDGEAKVRIELNSAGDEP